MDIIYSDMLGEVRVSEMLVAALSVYTPTVGASQAAKEKVYDASDLVWQVAARVDASNGKSVHTIEYRRVKGVIELKCTCHDFKIRKKGECKHTNAIDQSSLP